MKTKTLKLTVRDTCDIDAVIRILNKELKDERITLEPISDYEEKRFPLAKGSSANLGWTLDYDFLKTLTAIAANTSGEQIGMEETEAILLALNELPTP